MLRSEKGERSENSGSVDENRKASFTDRDGGFL